MQPGPNPLGDLAPDDDIVQPVPQAQLTPDPPAPEPEAIDLSWITADRAQNMVFEDVPEQHKRMLARAARVYSSDPLFLIVAATLTREYFKAFLQLDPKSPHYEMQCVRAQMACRIVGDVIGQYAKVGQYGSLDDAEARRLVEGSKS